MGVKTDSDPYIGKVVAKVRLTDKLGQGGMGAVYVGTHQTLQRQVAVKLLPPVMAQHAQWRERFKREARVAAQLDHPNAVRVLDAGDQKGLHYIVMEFVEGCSLADELDRGLLSVPAAVGAIRAAAAGLAAAHAIGMVHRDIKPDNLMRDTEGKVKVADFGLAREDGSGTPISVTGQLMGTPPYMAPEQAQGLPMDHRADIFSLGITLHALLSGCSPFAGANLLMTISNLCEKPLPPVDREDVPAGLQDVLQRMCAKEPNNRPDDMGAVIEALAPFDTGDLGTPTGPIPKPKMPKTHAEPRAAETPASSQKAVTAISVAVTAVCVLIVALMYFGGDPPADDAGSTVAAATAGDTSPGSGSEVAAAGSGSETAPGSGSEATGSGSPVIETAEQYWEKRYAAMARRVEQSETHSGKRTIIESFVVGTDKAPPQPFVVRARALLDGLDRANYEAKASALTAALREHERAERYAQALDALEKFPTPLGAKQEWVDELRADQQDKIEAHALAALDQAMAPHLAALKEQRPDYPHLLAALRALPDHGLDDVRARRDAAVAKVAAAQAAAAGKRAKTVAAALKAGAMALKAREFGKAVAQLATLEGDPLLKRMLDDEDLRVFELRSIAEVRRAWQARLADVQEPLEWSLRLVGEKKLYGDGPTLVEGYDAARNLVSLRWKKLVSRKVSGERIGFRTRGTWAIPKLERARRDALLGVYFALAGEISLARTRLKRAVAKNKQLERYLPKKTERKPIEKKPREKKLVTSGPFVITARMRAFFKQRDALPAAKQWDLVHKKLSAINPGWRTQHQNDATHRGWATDTGKVVLLELGWPKLVHIWPVHGLPLREIQLQNTGVWDLRPLIGAKDTLRKVQLDGTPVMDLTPLKDCALDYLGLLGCAQLTDKGLAPLAQTRIQSLELSFCTRLTTLPALGQTSSMSMAGCAVRDFRPLDKWRSIDTSGGQNLHLRYLVDQLKPDAYVVMMGKLRGDKNRESAWQKSPLYIAMKLEQEGKRGWRAAAVSKLREALFRMPSTNPPDVWETGTKAWIARLERKK